MIDRLLLLLLLLLLTVIECHSVAVVLTPVQTKQIIKNIHKRNNTKHSKYQYTYYQNTHTLQNNYSKSKNHRIHTQIKYSKYKQVPSL